MRWTLSRNQSVYVITTNKVLVINISGHSPVGRFSNVNIPFKTYQYFDQKYVFIFSSDSQHIFYNIAKTNIFKILIKETAYMHAKNLWKCNLFYVYTNEMFLWCWICVFLVYEVKNMLPPTYTAWANIDKRYAILQ